jgi:Domain of Unknown Function (DUF1206)
MPCWIHWIVLVTGHLGHLARGAVFLFVAVLFFRTIEGEVGEGRTTVGDALNQLEGSAGGKTVLFLLGNGFQLHSKYITPTFMVYGLVNAVASFPEKMPKLWLSPSGKFCEAYEN